MIQNKTGERERFEALVPLHMRGLHNMPLHLVQSKADSEGLVNELDLRAYGHGDRFRFISAWVGITAAQVTNQSKA